MKSRNLQSKPVNRLARTGIALALLVGAVIGIRSTQKADAASDVVGTLKQRTSMADCNSRGVVEKEMPSASPSTDAPKFDPGSAWLESDVSQSEVDSFWKKIKYEELDEVGAWIDSENEEFRIKVDPFTSVMEKVRAIASESFSKINYSVSERCISIGDLNEMMMQTKEQLLEILKSGVAFSIGISEETSTVNVSIEKKDVVVFQSELSEVADARIILEISPTVGQMGFSARCGDSAPHYGGSLYRNSTDSTCSSPCTTGYKVKRLSDGVIGMSSAGHCRHLQPAWSGNLYSSYSFYGQFSNWQFGGNNDWSFITSSTYSPVYYTDPCSPCTRTSTGAATASVGNSICLSGGVTGARCSMTITNLSFTNCAQGICVYNVEGVRGDRSLSCQQGDSGGPWFSSSTSKVYGVQSFFDGTYKCYYNPVGRMTAYGYQVMTS
jgi:hypothetical protein